MSGAEPVVNFESVSKSYDGNPALKNISFEIPTGTIFGCVGPNGAGKTTIIRLILGLLNPDKGVVRVFGRDPTCLSFVERRRVGYVLETPCLYADLTVRENLNFFARIYGMKSTARGDDGEIDSVVKNLAMSDHVDKPTGWLSKGMRQKLALHCAMLPNPDLLILDEPLSGLDPIHQKEIQQTLRSYRDRGGTAFLCSHDMTLIEKLCEMVLFLKNGRSLGVVSAQRLPQRLQANTWIVRVISKDSKDLLMERLHQNHFHVNSSEDLYLEVTIQDGSEADFLAFLSSQATLIREVKRALPTFEDTFFDLMGKSDG